MLEQVEDHDLPARTKNLESGIACVSWRAGMLKRPAQKHQTGGLRFARCCVEITQPELNVLEPILLRLGNSELNNPLRIINGEYLLRLSRQQFRKQSFPCSQVRDHE